MGASSSIPSGISSTIGTTHAEAFTNTEQTRNIMNEILNYMIKQISVRDLLQMSKSSECKKYVLFKANSLYQYFHELRVFPSTDSRGLLTFRKVDDLVSPKGDMEKERQSLCLIIAYFYTRIFQIYGALALTLIDDINFMTSTGLTSILPKGTNARTLTPGYYSQSAYSGVGGDITIMNQITNPPPSDKVITLKHFEWIRSFLTSSSSLTGYTTRYIGSGDNKGFVFLKLEDVFKESFAKDAKIIPSYSIGSVVSTVQIAQFKIGIPGSNDYYSFDIYTQKTPDTITVKTGKLTFKNTYDETITVERFSKTFRIEYKPPTNSVSKGTYIIKDSIISEVAPYMAELLSEVIVYLKSAIKQRKESEYFTSERRSNGIVPKSEEGIPTHLKVEKMITDLTKQRPLGHCIARALQLLRSEPFDNKPGISQICRVRFSDEKDDKVSTRIGLPKKGKPLSEHPGLFALADLFYDTITIGSPKLTIGRSKESGGRSSFDDYVTFMRNMSIQYGDDIKDESKLEEAGLDSISNKRDAEFCKTDDDIPLSLSATRDVHKIVKTMFQAQITHAGKCYQIINKLFSIQYEQGTKRPIMFKLNNSLIVKGFPELESINIEARNLLVNYYTDCEKKYLDGMKYVLEDKKSRNDAATAQVAQATQAQATQAQATQAQAKPATVAPTKVTKQAIPVKPTNKIIRPTQAPQVTANQSLALAKQLEAAATEAQTGSTPILNLLLAKKRR